jgi:hypothetical protein
MQPITATMKEDRNPKMLERLKKTQFLFDFTVSPTSLNLSIGH